MKKFYRLGVLVFLGLTVSAAAQQVHVFRTGSAYLGVSIRDVTADDVTELKLPAESGVYITGVQEDSPAAEAGLRTADVMMEYAGWPLLSVSQLLRLVGETPVGRSVDLKIIRDGAESVVRVEIGRREYDRLRGARVFSAPGLALRELPRLDFDFGPNVLRMFYGGRLGVTAQSLTDQMADFLGVPGGEGVLVTEVEEKTPGAEAGLKAGDVIVAIDGDAVERVSELNRALTPGTHELEIVRNKATRTVSVEIGQSRRDRDTRSLRLRM